MKFLKFFGIVIIILVATVFGAALRLREVFYNPSGGVLPLPTNRQNVSGDSKVSKVSVELAVGVSNGSPSAIDRVQGSVNILVVGLDSVDGVSRTDAIAMAVFDADNQSVRLTSIPRDSRVYIPGHGWDKINHAYVYGNISLLRETLVNLTGIPIDYFVKISYQSFPRIVDLLGGVDIYVEKRLRYTDYSGKLFINIPAGQQHLNGKNALGYVRFRHDPLGDIGRIQRQQKFMDQIMKKLKSPSIIPKIPALINEVINAVDTDLSPLQALQLLQFANSLPSGRINMAMAPGKAGYSGNVSYWILDNVAFSMQLASKLPPATEAETQEIQANALAQSNAQSNTKSGQTSQTAQTGGDNVLAMASSGNGVNDRERLSDLRIQVGSIRILNGDGEKGIGKRAAQAFQRIGIEVPYTGNARHFDYYTTNIIYPPGDQAMREGALALAELCGITNHNLIKEDRRASGSVTLILGHDKETLFKRINNINTQ